MIDLTQQSETDVWCQHGQAGVDARNQQLRTERRTMNQSFAMTGVPEESPLPAHGRAPLFGDAEQAREYQQSVQKQRDAQTSEFCVAPWCHVDLGTRRFEGGDPIATTDGISHRDLVRLSELKILTRLTEDELRVRTGAPADVEFVYVRPVGHSAPGAGYVIDHWNGDAALVAHFAHGAEPEVVEVPTRIADNGTWVPGTAGRPAREASDGAKEFAAAIEAGIIKRNPSYRAPTPESSSKARRA